MNPEIILPIIGYMKSSYQEKFGIPRQPNLVNSMAYIKMEAPYDDIRAFEGITQFSNLWLLWQFHDNKRKNNAKDFQPLIRPPRLGGNQKVGVFASRSMYRPAPIGLSVVEFVEIKHVGQELRLYVRGADLLDNTPIVDIKPYLAYVDSIPNAKSGYAQTAPKLLTVQWSDEAQQQQLNLMQQGRLDNHLINELVQILALDPTPAYQDDPNRIYGLSFAHLNVKFTINQQNILIQKLEIVA